MNKIDRMYWLGTSLIWITWAAAMIAIVHLCSGCGSVESAPDRGVDAIAVDAGADQAHEKLDAPASETPTENPPDAGAPEVAPARCDRGGVRAQERDSCTPGCSTCDWADFSLPAPSGCALSTEKLCAASCSVCP